MGHGGPLHWIFLLTQRFLALVCFQLPTQNNQLLGLITSSGSKGTWWTIFCELASGSQFWHGTSPCGQIETKSSNGAEWLPCLYGKLEAASGQPPGSQPRGMANRNSMANARISVSADVCGCLRMSAARSTILRVSADCVCGRCKKMLWDQKQVSAGVCG